MIDYTFGDWYYYHNDKIPTGYVWNTCTPQSLTFYVANLGRMHGKLRDFYNVLYGRFSKAGKVVKKNNSAAVIELADGHKAVVRMEKDNVLVTWGNLKPTDEIDIDEYKDASEEYDTSGISYGYLNELFPDKEPTVEEMAVDDYDSVAVEEVVN